MKTVEGKRGLVCMFFEHEPDFILAYIQHSNLQPNIWWLMHRWRDLPAQPEFSAFKNPEVCEIRELWTLQHLSAT